MAPQKTRFERIPVEIVKKIAQPLPGNKTLEIDRARKAPAIQPSTPPERWREVAEQVQQEQDPQKMIGLVQQLIASFDDEELRKRRTFARHAETPQSRSAS